MKVAALDLGSNSFLCLICEVEQNRVTKIYSDEVEIVRLGQGLGTSGEFATEALERADQCLERFSETIRKQRPKKILAMATAAARTAKNSQELIRLGQKHQIPIQIIPGEKEALITYRGATSALECPGETVAVIDIGGGSTEIIVGRDQEILFKESAPIGGVNLTEKFISLAPVAANEQEALKEDVVLRLTEMIQKISAAKPTRLIAVAGTPTELAKIEMGGFDPDKMEGFLFPCEKLIEYVGKFAKSSVKDRIEILKVSPGRADIIYAGALILAHVAESLHMKEITISTRGVRFGTALELADDNI